MKVWITTAAALAIAGLVCGSSEAQPAGGGGGVVRKACHDDILQLCANVEPGGGRLIQCLREHQDRVSESCKSALSDAKASRRGHHASPDAPPPTTPEPGSGPG